MSRSLNNESKTVCRIQSLFAASLKFSKWRLGTIREANKPDKTAIMPLCVGLLHHKQINKALIRARLQLNTRNQDPGVSWESSSGEVPVGSLDFGLWIFFSVLKEETISSNYCVLKWQRSHVTEYPKGKVKVARCDLEWFHCVLRAAAGRFIINQTFLRKPH